MNKTGLFVFVSIFAVSCLSQPDCYQLNNNTVVAYFKIVGGGNDVVRVTRIQSPEALSLFVGDTTVSAIALPLNPKSEETLYEIQGLTATNTLDFAYKRQAQFVSEACGERFYYQNLVVPDHNYDSVRVVNPIPSPTPLPSGAKTIEIFRCAVTNQMRVTFTAETVVEQITADYAVSTTLPSGNLKDFVLPLNPSTAPADSTTTFVFRLQNNVTKKLKVRYARTGKEFGKACGLQMFLHSLHINRQVTDLKTTTVKADSLQDLPVINLEATP